MITGLLRIIANLLVAMVGLVLCCSTVSGEIVTGKSAFTPWSGYWWPISKGELIYGYNGHPSPLEKYDLFQKGFYPGSATNWEATNHWPFDPDVESWHGYCVPWANATIWEGAIDFQPSVNSGVLFLIGDKKGLMTLAHTKDPVRYEYCTEDPAVFHRWLVTYIGENKVPFAADLDPTEEMWAYPVYYYQMDITETGACDDFVTSIHCATDQVNPDYDGTKNTYRTYTYRLYKDVNGDYTHGEWTGASVNGHPETVWVPTAQVAENPYIDIVTVRQLAASGDDEVEGQGELPPGHYLLCLLPDDSDSFTWNLPEGTEFRLTAVFDDQSSGNMAASYTLTQNGTVIADGEISHTQTSLAFEDLQQGNYQLSLIAPASNVISAYIHLYVDIIFDSTVYLLDLPGSVDWMGMGVNNPQPTDNHYYISYLLSETGMPAASVDAGPSLDPGGHWAGLLPLTLPRDYFSAGTPELIRITSQAPLNLFELFGENDRLTGPPTTAAVFSGSPIQRVIPSLTALFSPGTSAIFSLFNASQQPFVYGINYYTAGGSWYRSVELDLNGRQYRRFIPGNYPGSIDHDGWAMVNDSTGQLIGKVDIQQGSLLGDSLPLLDAGLHFYLPHLTIGDGTWQTRLTLFNTTDSDVQLSLACNQDAFNVEQRSIQLNPHEKREIVLDSVFWGLTDAQISSSWMEISASAPVAGFFTYQFKDVSMASIPLMVDENFAPVKYLGHVAVDQQTWWTGLALLNTDSQQTVVEFIGLDDHGQQVVTVQRIIPAMDKSVISVGSLFPGYHEQVKSIKMTSGSSIAGLALYGTQKGNDQLSGIVLD